jgi:hypothetical protein
MPASESDSKISYGAFVSGVALCQLGDGVQALARGEDNARCD